MSDLVTDGALLGPAGVRPAGVRQAGVRQSGARPAGVRPAGLAWPADEAARFQALYVEFFRDLSDYCARLLGDDALAADVAQEAFTRLFARLATVRDPKAWLFLVATNLVRDEWRERLRRRRAATVLRADLAAASPTRDLTISDLVARLPERLARVVVLHYYADLSLRDIARLTHAPLGTVKRRLNEARSALLAALEER